MRLLSPRFCDFSYLSLFSVNFFPNIQHSRCFRLVKSLPRDVLFSFARHSRTIRLFSAPSFAAGPGDSSNSFAFPGFSILNLSFYYGYLTIAVLIRTTLPQFLLVDFHICHHSRGFCVPILPIIQHSRAFSHAIL